MSLRPSIPENERVNWYQTLWIAWPFALITMGGYVGGALGGGAWILNQKVFTTTAHPVLRYPWTGLISLAAVGIYLGLAFLFGELPRKG